MPSPKPLPTAILKLRGSWRAKLRDGEPEPGFGEPDCPDFLSGEARDEWYRVTANIASMCILAKVDINMLVAWCQAWARIVATSIELAKSSPMDFTSPAIRVQEKAIDQLARLADHFGLSPSARTRIRVPESQRKNAANKSRFFDKIA